MMLLNLIIISSDNTKNKQQFICLYWSIYCRNAFLRAFVVITNSALRYYDYGSDESFNRFT